MANLMNNPNIYGGMLGKPDQAYTRMSGTASGAGQKQPQTCPTGYQWDYNQGKCVAVNNTPAPSIGQQLGAPSTSPPSNTGQTTSFAQWGQPQGNGGQKKSTAELWAEVANNAINHLGNSTPVGNQLKINPNFIKMVTGR